MQNSIKHEPALESLFNVAAKGDVVVILIPITELPANDRAQN
jgi:hypothetical protein